MNQKHLQFKGKTWPGISRIGRFSLLLLFTVWLTAGGLKAQNYIQNPGFEQGPIPTQENQITYATFWENGCAGTWLTNGGGFQAQGTPDLFDSRSANCEIDIPANKWALNRNVQSGGYRYVGFSGGVNILNANGGYNYSESVMGNLDSPLQEDCNYNISLWASSVDGYGSPVTPCDVNSVVNSGSNAVQVVLRKTDCNGPSKVIFTSTGALPKAWTYFSGTFSLSAAEAAIGYDKIEFRMALQNPTSATKIVFMDNVSLTPPEEATAGMDVPEQVCLGAPLWVDGSTSSNESSHQWTITASNANGVTTWDPNTTWVSPWYAGPAGTVDLNALSGFNFQGGQHYLIRLAVRNCATAWTANHRVVFVAPLPNINAGPDIHICAGSNVTIGTPMTNTYLFGWSGSPIVTQNGNGTLVVNPTGQTDYILSAANSYGCTDRDTVTVFTDRFLGRISLTTTGGGDLCPEPWVISATPIANANYLWSTGATTSSITVNPSTPTTYSVTVSNACNSVITSTTITPNPGLTGGFPPIGFANWLTCSLPVAFTHTGLNWGDTPAYNATEYELRVFDRWGHMIHQDIQQAPSGGFWNGQIEWDGTASFSTNYTWWQQIWNGYVNSTAGQCVSVGVYIVQLRLRNCNNNSWVVWNDEVSYLGGRLPDEELPSTLKSGTNTPAELALYPNPSRDRSTVKLDLPGEKTIQVYDLKGQLVLEQTTTNTTSNIDMTNQAPGMFLIRVQCDGKTYSKRLIIQ